MHTLEPQDTLVISTVPELRELLARMKNNAPMPEALVFMDAAAEFMSKGIAHIRADIQTEMDKEKAVGKTALRGGADLAPLLDLFDKARFADLPTTKVAARILLAYTGETDYKDFLTVSGDHTELDMAFVRNDIVAKYCPKEKITTDSKLVNAALESVPEPTVVTLGRIAIKSKPVQNALINLVLIRN